MEPPCVYALIHRPTGKVYIGSTVHRLRRRHRWRQDIIAGRVRADMQLGPWEEWEVRVVREYPGASSLQLAAAEHQAVERLRVRAPGKLLNKIVVVRAALFPPSSLNGWSRSTGLSRKTIGARLKAGWTFEEATGQVQRIKPDARRRTKPFSIARMAIRIYDAGEALLTVEAAERLGLRQRALYMRIVRYRLRNPEAKQVQLAELRVKMKTGPNPHAPTPPNQALTHPNNLLHAAPHAPTTQTVCPYSRLQAHSQ